MKNKKVKRKHRCHVPIPTVCRYCGGPVVFTDSSILYGGRSYGSIYLCLNCNASVGVHRGTNEPLGTLANSILRRKRAQAHTAFDTWWKSRHISRDAAYRWLARQMGIPPKQAHIALFEAEQCEQVAALCSHTESKNAA